jgi:hypothetical protein
LLKLKKKNFLIFSLYLDVVTLSSTVVLVFSQVLFCCLFCELSDLTSPGIHPETRIFILFFGMKISVDVNIFVIFFRELWTPLCRIARQGCASPSRTFSSQTSL